uniref:Periplasmic/secreted protein n=1 Tax=uncultured Thiotrichaceae bacterium TaxID=298394 RepID=A0A6S6TT05_9GAMM|nr:MAG: Unknown protein [uncultured Thiotrichaceae bacterium]
MKLQTLARTGLLSGLLLISGHSFAAEESSYDRISFAVSAEKEVENDVLTATLFASQTGQNTNELADTVNKDISWAMDIAQQENKIENRTLGYTTNPVYKNGRVDGWQVRQNIELKSKDSKVLSGMLGQLQQKLRVQSIAYSISTEVRQATEESLISEALASFKNRAAQVQANMERSEYRVVRLDIQTGGNFPQPMFRGARAEGMMMADAAPTAPNLNAGKQKVKVSVNAQIELSAN